MEHWQGRLSLVTCCDSSLLYLTKPGFYELRTKNLGYKLTIRGFCFFFFCLLTTYLHSARNHFLSLFWRIFAEGNVNWSVKPWCRNDPWRTRSNMSVNRLIKLTAKSFSFSQSSHCLLVLKFFEPTWIIDFFQISFLWGKKWFIFFFYLRINVFGHSSPPQVRWVRKNKLYYSLIEFLRKLWSIIFCLRSW